MVGAVADERAFSPALSPLPERSLEEIMAAALEGAAASPPPQAPELVLQEFTPLASSLEAELSSHYWRSAGVQAFSGGAVPFIINNSGRLSECAAQVVFGYCLETAPEGTIDLLELGAGSGLFALYFLDAFRAVCQRQDRDFYSRLRYHVTDGSTATVTAWTRQAQFEEHADRVVLGICDAVRPVALTGLDGSSHPLPLMRVIFANYLLDSLPAAIVRHGETQPEQLCLRTYLSDPAELASLHPGTTTATLIELAQSPDPAIRATLLPYLGLFDFEASFQPVPSGGLPFLEAALAMTEPGIRTLLNYGALTAVDSCAALLHENGFFVLADYGPVDKEVIASEATPTRFGQSTALGINFPLLESVAAGLGLSVATPKGDAAMPIHARLLARASLPLTCDTFKDRYSRETWNKLDAPTELARRLALLDDLSGALAAFGHALRLNRQDWTVMAEMARFLMGHDTPQAIELAQHALRKNPWYSPSLWVLLGDALFKADDMEGARKAFESARRLDPADAAACHGLSYVLAAQGKYREAIDLVVTGLLSDRYGQFRDALMSHLGNLVSTVTAQTGNLDVRMLRRSQAFETAT